MENVKFKIVGYEETTGSLLVSFASDTTLSSNPEDYQAVAFQPSEMWPDLHDIEQIKIQLAKAGIDILQRQERKEAFITAPSRVLQLKELVNGVFEYPVLRLTEPQDTSTAIVVM